MKCIWSCVFLLFFNCCLLVLGMEVIMLGDGNEFQIGKFENSDEIFLDTDFDFLKKPYSKKLDSSYNGTHFFLNYVGPPKTCISSIVLQSYADDTQKPSTKKSRIWCQKGGIGKNSCLLVFRMRDKREDARVKIFGVREPCSFKERYSWKNPKKIDAYGQPYRFSPTYPNWNLPREKDGLLNTQMNYLDKSDKFTMAREKFVPDNTLKFTMDFTNSGQYRISFLDIYWFQQSQNGKPKLPYIYYNGHCTSSNKTCQVIFDADEPMSYVFVKVFNNVNHNELRLLPDVSRFGK